MSDVYEVEDLMLRAETNATMKANIKYQQLETKYEELRQKVKDWHDRLEKGLEHSSTHLFKELIDVYKEMENQ